MKFESGDLVQLSQEGITRGKALCALPKNRVGKVLKIECEPCATGPAIYIVDFDGTGVFVTEPLIEAAGPLDRLADISKDDRVQNL